jgi:hypothetical protein
MALGTRRLSRSSDRGRQRWLVGLELFTGAAGVAGGGALAARPDGSLLQAKLTALDGSPFRDWRVPGALLAILVGGGFLLSGTAELRRWRHARALSTLAGLGLVVFEGAELAWIGPQPLEALFAAIGIAVAALAMTSDRAPETWLLRDRRGLPETGDPRGTEPGAFGRGQYGLG